ncbi:MAG: NAD-dependent epimerase/dehydratase family protein [Puniceicoccales bacterium]|jgi:UDP-glucose 4-epimerase|nr:NAD-dependent epimerase/dehydratase family protein [Puniceicoccales bacterium]
MNILVLGAAGFVGSHLVKKLSTLGHRVSAVDIDNARAKQVLGKNIPFYCCNYGVQSAMQSVLKKENVELIVQCAGISDIAYSVANPTECYASNAIGNIFLLDFMVKGSVGKFLYMSSASVFGEIDRMPITPNSVRCPISPLGNAQLFIENALESYRTSHGLTYAVVRGSNVTGMSEIENEYFVKNQGSGLISEILRYIVGESEAVNIFGTTYDTIDTTAERDYIHVDDLCNACLNVIAKLSVRGEGMVFNVGSGRKYSVREVITTAENIFGVKIKTVDFPQRVGDPSRAYFDINETRNRLEWFPKYDSLELIFGTMFPYFSGKQKHPAV